MNKTALLEDLICNFRQKNLGYSV